MNHFKPLGAKHDYGMFNSRRLLCLHDVGVMASLKLMLGKCFDAWFRLREISSEDK